MVEAQRGGKHDETYQNRYRASAIAAADSLGGTFSGIVGHFLRNVGWRASGKPCTNPPTPVSWSGFVPTPLPLRAYIPWMSC